MVTIAGVEVSKDLSSAKVYVSAFSIESEGAEKRKEMISALNQGGGYMRKLLGGRMRLRVVPTLKFFYDEVQQAGSILSSRIDDAVASNTTDADSDDEFQSDDSVWKKSL